MVPHPNEPTCPIAATPPHSGVVVHTGGVDKTEALRLGLLRATALAVGWLILLVGVAAVVLYAVPSLHVRDARLAMAASFIPYGVLAWLAATLIFALAARRRAKLLVLVTLAGLILQVVWARPYWPGPSPAPANDAVTVMSINLRCDGEGLEDLGADVARIEPDVLVLQGADPETRAYFGEEGWPGEHPHSTFHPLGVDPECGKVVISDSPVVDVTLPEDERPVIRVDLPTGPLTVVPVDAPTPLEDVARWDGALAEFQRTAVNHAGGSVLMVGDFNAVREHLPLRRMLGTGWENAAEKSRSGWLPTYPSNAWHPPALAIDHAIVSPGLRALSVETFSVMKNPHLGLIVRLTSP